MDRQVNGIISCAGKLDPVPPHNAAHIDHVSPRRAVIVIVIAVCITGIANRVDYDCMAGMAVA